jgi:uncharacterized protein
VLNKSDPTLRRPILGVLLAIAITTGMDANGLSTFSALPLFPLTFGFWFLQRISRSDMGFTWGQWRHYILAVWYPLLVLGAVALVSTAAGAINVSTLNWHKALLNVALTTVVTTIVVTVTEEGFFRGWLWAALQLTGMHQNRILLGSSVAFALWHLSWVTLTTDKLPIGQVPIFILNAAVVGSIWGLMRWISGSVVVASVSHGLWNGLDYVFFGFGARVGALKIVDTAIFGPEVGILGLVANVLFAVALWLIWRGHRRRPSASP